MGNFELRGVCKVAGLGGNPYCDGSHDYSVNTDVVSNDPKGGRRLHPREGRARDRGAR
ncbi:MAG: hypothetical protein QM756_13880 [Polyangiaceae bacterium]